MSDDESDVQKIAAGGEPSWEQTFPHPQYGDLTFRVARMPTVGEWMGHANAIDAVIISHGGSPDAASYSSKLLAATIAGMRPVLPGVEPIIQVPVIDEKRIDDPDTPGRQKVELVYYDPTKDEAVDFAMNVWNSFFAWRLELLGKVDEVGKSSRATGGDDSGGSSPAATDSPSTTPDLQPGQILTTSASSPT